MDVSDASLKALAASTRHSEFDADEDGLVWEALQMQDALQHRTGAIARVHVEVRSSFRTAFTMAAALSGLAVDRNRVAAQRSHNYKTLRIYFTALNLRLQ